MLKIFKTKAMKNKKKNIMAIGRKGTGMVRTYLKPFVSVKGEELLNPLLIRGKYAGYGTHFSDDEIYIALQKCRNLIPRFGGDIPCYDISPLSARQGFCSNATIKLIIDNEYNDALHEFEDCIDDYGKGRSRYITKNELILYNCILTCFITRLEKQSANKKDDIPKRYHELLGSFYLIFHNKDKED